MSPQRQVCTELLDKFPDAPTRTLASIAYRDNSKLWSSEESVRCYIRKMRGQVGASMKATHPRPPQPQGDPFGKIPPQRNPFKAPWDAVRIDGPAKVLLLHDIHIPFHELTPLCAALRAGRDRKPDIILLNGDIIDCHAVSYWQKDPRQRDFAGELQSVRSFLAILREAFPKARIVYKWGNHEERWESYMFAKAPECLGVDDFELSSLLRFKDQGIEEVGEKRPIRLGDLNIIHGHEYRFAIANPVNAARGLFLRAKSYALCGHFHQSAFHSENNLSLKSIAAWAVGCLCQLHQDYAPLNNWSSGFAWIEVDKNDRFEVNNYVIKGGKIY